MPIPISQLAMAVENAIFRNYIEKGMRLFTPHMFISDETGDTRAVLSVLFSLCKTGILQEQLKLRECGTQNVLRQIFTGQQLLEAQQENPDLKEAEVLYAFILNEDYVRMRLEAEIEGAKPPAP